MRYMKFIITVLYMFFSLAALAQTNSLDQLISGEMTVKHCHAEKPQMCTMPINMHEKDHAFCKCFYHESIVGCNYIRHCSIWCKGYIIDDYYRSLSSDPKELYKTCIEHKDDYPEGVTPELCSEILAYYKKYCL